MEHLEALGAYVEREIRSAVCAWLRARSPGSPGGARE